MPLCVSLGTLTQSKVPENIKSKLMGNEWLDTLLKITFCF
jgi:hypothetical protein